jgi:hypothetical protein
MALACRKTAKDFMKKIFWIVNYTEQANKGRTAFCVLFEFRRDAIAFSRNKYGYIIRGEDEKRTFDSYFGGFEPSATEGASMKHLLGYFPEPKRVDKLSIAYAKGRGCNKSTMWLMNKIGA